MTTWPRRAQIALAIGAVLWLSAMAMVPGELASAKRHARVDARTVTTGSLFLVAALLVLYGLPRRDAPPPLPSIPPPPQK